MLLGHSYASLFQEQASRLTWMQYNLLKRRLERWSNFQIYNQMRIYRKEFVFKPFSNHLFILVGWNLSFTNSLHTSYFEMDG